MLDLDARGKRPCALTPREGHFLQAITYPTRHTERTVDRHVGGHMYLHGLTADPLDGCPAGGKEETLFVPALPVALSFGL